MNPIRLVLVVLALVCEGLAVSNLVGGENRIKIIAAGLTAFFASFISW